MCKFLPEPAIQFSNFPKIRTNIWLTGHIMGQHSDEAHKHMKYTGQMSGYEPGFSVIC